MSRRKSSRRQEEHPVSRFLLKFSSKILLAGTIVVVFLSLIQCTVKKPESPEFTTGLAVPVINRTYGMEELVRRIDQDGISMDSAGNVIFSISEEIDTVRLSKELLSTPDVSVAIAQQVGVVNIPEPTVSPVSVALSSITGVASSLPGDSATVSPGNFTVSNAPPSIAEYSEASVASATVYAVLANNLGVDLDSVTVELFDVDSNRVVTSSSFPSGLPQGITDSVPLVLDGAVVSNDLVLRSHCHTPGGTVDSVSTRDVSTTLNFDGDISVDYARARVNGFSEFHTETVGLQEVDRVDSAVIQTGTLELDLSNATDLPADLVLTVPDVRQAGQALTITESLTSRENRTTTVDLSGYVLRPSDQSVPQEISVELAASTPGSGTQEVTVYASDSFLVAATMQGVQFASVTGQFDGAVSDFAPVSQDIDIPLGFDAVTLTSAVLSLDIINGVNLPGSLSAVIVGDNGKQLAISGAIAPGTPEAPVITTLVEQNAADFLSPVPSRVDITGSAVYGDGQSAGTITSEDFVVGQVRVESPLDLIINETTFESDVEPADIDTADIDVITDHVVEARFVYSLANHLPIGASLAIAFSGDSATLFSNPELLIDDLNVPAASVSTDGLVQTEELSGIQEVVLSNADIQVLRNDTLFVGPVVTLESSNGQRVRFTQNDYITVNGVFEVEYIFDGDF